MIIALASPRIASSVDEGLEKVQRLMSDASAQGAEIVCFPEAYLPGLRGQDFEVPSFDQSQQEKALQAVGQWARVPDRGDPRNGKDHRSGKTDRSLCHERAR